ncbi:MAG: NCS2 family permease, partial [Clostridia bacterium]|nr:NCS2 family permease [Clostridia bacterium]
MSEQNANPQTPETAKKTLGGKVDSFFGVSKRGSTFKTEIVAGIVTFLAMCYILTVNPNQFFYAGTADPRWTAVFMSTAFGAIIGTLLMAFLAKLPLAQAPGMGLNSLVGSIIGGGLGFYAYQFSFSLGNAMLMVLISGLIFLLLSVVGFKGKSLRQLIFDGIPEGIRRAIPVGIGLFIAYIGFQNAGFIITNGYTQVGVVDFTNWGEQVINWAANTVTTPQSALVMLFGLVVIAILSRLNVKGAVIFGILAATLLGIPLGVTNVAVVTGSVDGITWKFWENFANYFAGENSVFAICFTEGFNLPA